MYQVPHLSQRAHKFKAFQIFLRFKHHQIGLMDQYLISQNLQTNKDPIIISIININSFRSTYNITVILFLSLDKGICAIFTPSISIFPESASKSLKILLIMVDFPAPVRPTTPT